MDGWGAEADDWGTDADNREGESNVNGLADNTLDFSTEHKDSNSTESVTGKSHEECFRSNMNNNHQLVTCSDLNKPSKSSLLVEDIGSVSNDEEELVSGLSNIEVDSENSMNVIVEDDLVDTDRLNEVMSVIKEASNSLDNPLPNELCLLSFYVNVLEEPEDSLDTVEEKHIKQLLKSYEREQGAVDEEMQARFECLLFLTIDTLTSLQIVSSVFNVYKNVRQAQFFFTILKFETHISKVTNIKK